MKNKKKFLLLAVAVSAIIFTGSLGAQDIKKPDFSGQFYPEDPNELSQMIDGFIKSAAPGSLKGDIFAIICPHAGYQFSGQTAAFGYKLIKDKPYRTVVVIGSAHHGGFSGIAVYPEGLFRTPLGDIEIDSNFVKELLGKERGVFSEPRAFSAEHAVEVELPFLQKVLTGFKIVPVMTGDCSFALCKDFANLLRQAIGERKDVLIVVSSDLYHGYDHEELERVDGATLSYLKNMDAEGLYNGLTEGRLQMCGGIGAVAAIILAKESGHNSLTVLNHTNSGIVTGRLQKGIWTVGYASCAIDSEKGEAQMLNKEQRKKLLEIARSSIETYLKTGKKLEVSQTDPVLSEKMGAFVTLHEKGELRGCIGNIVGTAPLYLTVRDMAVEAAVEDPRFAPVQLSELKDIEIEVSALSPLKKVDSADEIQMGVHGVIVKRGFNSGVFLPQVATETGWSKEEFLSQLCAQKAGLSPDAWKDKSTELYVFTAEVFSEKNY